MHIREEKAHLRQSITEHILRMPDKSRATESRSLCKRILENLPQGLLIIAGYAPLKSEADILPLLETLIERGDRVYLPVFTNNILTFRSCSGFSQLTPGALNILEPPESAPVIDPLELNIALVPGRAFDRSCHRLGRGNGGYDKWIRIQRQRNPNTKFWGIAFECQIVNDVPREKHDERVDNVITARGFVSPPPLPLPLGGD